MFDTFNVKTIVRERDISINIPKHGIVYDPGNKDLISSSKLSEKKTYFAADHKIYTYFDDFYTVQPKESVIFVNSDGKNILQFIISVFIYV